MHVVDVDFLFTTQTWRCLCVFNSNKGQKSSPYLLSRWYCVGLVGKSCISSEITIDLIDFELNKQKQKKIPEEQCEISRQFHSSVFFNSTKMCLNSFASPISDNSFLFTCKVIARKCLRATEWLVTFFRSFVFVAVHFLAYDIKHTDDPSEKSNKDRPKKWKVHQPKHKETTFHLCFDETWLFFAGELTPEVYYFIVDNGKQQQIDVISAINKINADLMMLMMIRSPIAAIHSVCCVL